MNRTKIISIVSIVVFVIAIGITGFVLIQNRALKQEQRAFAEEEKGRMQEELTQLSEDYEAQLNKLNEQREFTLTFANDSLLQQLEEEKAQIERLQKELKEQKGTSTKRIRELTDEINTLRNLLRSYIAQIDSLYTVNQELTRENTQVKEELTKANVRVDGLSQERAELAGKVQRAALLSASKIAVRSLNKRGSNTKRIDKIANLSVQFTVPRNVTAEVGYKTFYIRILNPNDQPLSGGKAFVYEGQTLLASAQKEVEYTGEDTEVIVYKEVTEALLSGTYRVDIFADGHLIGKHYFTL